MLISDFDFDLPEELIARYPLEKRDESRLLHYNLESKSVQHKKFQDISQILESGDIFVIPPYEIADPEFIEDCEIVILKTPSNTKDKYVIDIKK